MSDETVQHYQYNILKMNFNFPYISHIIFFPIEPMHREKNNLDFIKSKEHTKLLYIYPQWIYKFYGSNKYFLNRQSEIIPPFIKYNKAQKYCWRFYQTTKINVLLILTLPKVKICRQLFKNLISS